MSEDTPNPTPAPDFETPPEADSPDASPLQLEEPRRAFSRRFFFAVIYGFILIIFAGLGVVLGFYLTYMVDLPEVQALEGYRPSLVTEIFSEDNKPLGQLFLERRKLVNPSEIPGQFKEAVIAIEDKSYYDHFGIDVRRIIQSAIMNLLNMKVVRGASTITQQLSKLLFLTPEVSMERKVKEAILAIQIEKHYSKERIFTFYANKIYLGHGNYGIASASEYFFDKPVQELDLAECALLAAIVKNPGRYSPVNHPDNAIRRRNLVLAEMREENFITDRQLREAKAKPLHIVGKELDRAFAGYFVEMVRQHLQQHYTNKQIFTEGLKVYTTLNWELQAKAEKALQEGLRTYDKRKGWRGKLPNVIEADPSVRLDSYKHPGWHDPPEEKGIYPGLVMAATPESAEIRLGLYRAELTLKQAKWTRKKSLDSLFQRGDVALFTVEKIHEEQRRLEVSLSQHPVVQGSFLAIENKTGAIRALVGGYDWSESKFNRAVQAKRQTGSIFKPFVYTAAFISGMEPDDIVLDEPLTIMSDVGVPYTPNNYDGVYRGPISLREALADSRNIPAVKVAVQVGIPEVIRTARRFGITAPLHPYPSTALGASEVTLKELVSAFSTFPNDGYRAVPFFIQRVEDFHGNVLEENRVQLREAAAPDITQKMVSMLRGSVEFGTSQKAKALNVQLGGKTGTTNDFTDAWFIGFTPSLTAGVWVGYDEKRTLGNEETGAHTALPIWIEFMKGYLAGRPRENFPSATAPYLPPPSVDDKINSMGIRRRVIEEQDLTD